MMCHFDEMKEKLSLENQVVMETLLRIATSSTAHYLYMTSLAILFIPFTDPNSKYNKPHKNEDLMFFFSFP